MSSVCERVPDDDRSGTCGACGTMNDIETLPHMLKQAMAALDNATTAAEILEAHERAGAAYDLAKRAARFAKVKDAHGKMLAACHRMQADALMIEARAQIRLADEYDAAQERGEVQKAGGDRKGKIIIPDQNNDPTVTDIGLTSKEVHEARQVRDAEAREPGLVRKTVDAKLAAGEEPTRADVKRAVKLPRKETDRDRDRKTCIALDLKVTDANHALEQWLLDHPGYSGAGCDVSVSEAVAQIEARPIGRTVATTNGHDDSSPDYSTMSLDELAAAYKQADALCEQGLQEGQEGRRELLTTYKKARSLFPVEQDFSNWLAENNIGPALVDMVKTIIEGGTDLRHAPVTPSVTFEVDGNGRFVSDDTIDAIGDALHILMNIENIDAWLSAFPGHDLRRLGDHVQMLVAELDSRSGPAKAKTKAKPKKNAKAKSKRKT
jgi:hypothetical protein